MAPAGRQVAGTRKVGGRWGVRAGRGSVSKGGSKVVVAQPKRHRWQCKSEGRQVSVVGSNGAKAREHSSNKA